MFTTAKKLPLGYLLSLTDRHWLKGLDRDAQMWRERHTALRKDCKLTEKRLKKIKEKLVHHPFNKKLIFLNNELKNKLAELQDEIVVMELARRALVRLEDEAWAKKLRDQYE